MSSLEKLPDDRSVGEIFTAIHSAAYEVASAVPVFDESRRDAPDEGEIYSHVQKWQHPKRDMPASSIMTRVMAEDGSAPFLMEVWSLHSEDEPGAVLPCRVRAFDHVGDNLSAQIENQYPHGLINVERGYRYSKGKQIKPRVESTHRETTKYQNLRAPDRERLDEVKSAALGMIVATRCLLTIEALDVLNPVEERTQSARASVADVFTLLGNESRYV